MQPFDQRITTTDFSVSENITLGEPRRLSDTLCRVHVFVAGDKGNSSHDIVIPANKLVFAGVEGQDSVVSFSLVKQKWNGLQVIRTLRLGRLHPILIMEHQMVSQTMFVRMVWPMVNKVFLPVNQLLHWNRYNRDNTLH